METRIMEAINGLAIGEKTKFKALVIGVTPDALNGQLLTTIQFLTANENFALKGNFGKKPAHLQALADKYMGKIAQIVVGIDEKKNTLSIQKMDLVEDCDVSEFLPTLDVIATLGDKQSAKAGALVTNIEAKESRNGSLYSSISLTDGKNLRTLTCFATKTDSDIETYKTAYVGKIAVIRITCDSKEKGFYRIDQICAEVPCAKREKFVNSAPLPSETMYNEIMEKLTSFTDGNDFSIARIAMGLYEKNKDKLLWAAAAMKMHHETVGGLLYHTYRMMKVAEKFCDVYPLDRELLLTGIVTHDIGKLRELETDESGKTTYTVDGNLFGHILLGSDMIIEEYKALPDDYREKNRERIRLLRHMVVSHHGTMEHGAIKQPATAEARALHDIDMFDSRYYTYEKESRNLDEGEMSDRQWALEGACVYHPIS